MIFEFVCCGGWFFQLSKANRLDLTLLFPAAWPIVSQGSTPVMSSSFGQVSPAVVPDIFESQACWIGVGVSSKTKHFSVDLCWIWGYGCWGA